MTNRTIKLETIISGVNYVVDGVVVSNESDWMSVAVKSLEDAFKMSYCYRHCKSTKIEKLPTTEIGEYLVVVYKNVG